MPETMLTPEDGESELNASISHTHEVPVLTFNLSITAAGIASDAISNTVASALRNMWGTRAITEVDLLYDSKNSSRRMSTMRTLVVTLKYLTMEEAETFAEEVDLSIASDAVLDTLRQDEVLGIIDVQPSNVSVSLLPLICRANALVPPGVTIRNVEECLCTSGYEYLEESKGCSPCGIGEYKSTLANDKCQSCPIRKSTLKVGGASIQDCICQIGTFDVPIAHPACTAQETGSLWSVRSTLRPWWPLPDRLMTACVWPAITRVAAVSHVSLEGIRATSAMRLVPKHAHQMPIVILVPPPWKTVFV